MAYQSRKKKQQKDYKVRFRVWGILASIVALFGAVYYLSRYEPWMFTEVVFEENERVDVGKVEQEIWLEVQSPWYVLFAQNNRLFFPKTRVTQLILDNYPLIKTVEVVPGKNQVLSIVIEERGPQYVVCDQGIPKFEILTSEEKDIHCAFVDYNGLAYEMYDSNVIHGAFFVDQNIGEVRVPRDFFNPEEIAYLREITARLEGFDLKKIIFRPTESTDVYLTQDFYIKFTELTSFEEQILNIEIALGKPLAEILFDEYEYIDARFPGKLYVRERVEGAISADEVTEEVKTAEEALSEPLEETVDNDEVLEDEA